MNECKHEFMRAYMSLSSDGTETNMIISVCKKCLKTKHLIEANERIDALEEQIANYETFGQGGASFSDSQWLDKLSRQEQRAELAESTLEFQDNNLQIANERIDALVQQIAKLQKVVDAVRKDISGCNQGYRVEWCEKECISGDICKALAELGTP